MTDETLTEREKAKDFLVRTLDQASKVVGSVRPEYSQETINLHKEKYLEAIDIALEQGVNTYHYDCLAIRLGVLE